jgi:predicted small lipoprotein YifL
MMARARLVMTLVLVGSVAALTACGRKAPLDSPYEAQIEAAKAAKTTPPEPPVEDKPFVLDPLL